MSKILESGFESVVLTLLAEMGFSCHGGDAFDPDASGERESYHGAMLPGRLKAAVARINPDLPPEAVDAAANAVLDFRFTEMVQENQRIHLLLVDGVPVEYQRGGETIHDRARLVDWKDDHNEWLAVNQFTVVGANKRRTDILIFLNGLPSIPRCEEGTQEGAQSAHERRQGGCHLAHAGLGQESADGVLRRDTGA
jgi:type I restriction enzyme R subunit